MEWLLWQIQLLEEKWTFCLVQFTLTSAHWMADPFPRIVQQSQLTLFLVGLSLDKPRHHQLKLYSKFKRKRICSSQVSSSSGKLSESQRHQNAPQKTNWLFNSLKTLFQPDRHYSVLLPRPVKPPSLGTSLNTSMRHYCCGGLWEAASHVKFSTTPAIALHWS